ncbi:MAG: phosphatase PAP2 family protein [bacterium]|nr:phosphatase PAP2 family protein [bacterium]
MTSWLAAFDEHWFRGLNSLVLNPKVAIWVFGIALYGIAIYLLVFIWLWYRPGQQHHHHHQKTVVLATLTVFLTMIATQVADVVINRPRPAVFYHDIIAFNVLVDQASFPSLHTAVAFGITAILWLMHYRKLAVGSLILAIAIALSRVAAGVHYPTDIIAGAILGFGAGWLIYREAAWLRDYLPAKKGTDQ